MKNTTWSSAFTFYIIKIKSLIYMQEIIQYIIVAAVIIAAIAYVVYRVGLAFRSSRSGCYGCSGCALKEQMKKRGKNGKTQLRKPDCFH